MRTLVLVLGMVAVVMGQEIAVPDKPVPSTITSYHIVGFSQEREPDWRFTITYKDSNGKIYEDVHYGLSLISNPAGGAPIANPEGADAFLKQMNTTNFSTTSMMKRLYQHLVTHGKIPASTVTGAPDGDADELLTIDSSLGTITSGPIDRDSNFDADDHDDHDGHHETCPRTA